MILIYSQPLEERVSYLESDVNNLKNEAKELQATIDTIGRKAGNFSRPIGRDSRLSDAVMVA